MQCRKNTSGGVVTQSQAESIEKILGGSLPGVVLSGVAAVPFDKSGPDAGGFEHGEKRR